MHRHHQPWLVVPGERGKPAPAGHTEAAGAASPRFADRFRSPGQVMTGRPSGKGCPPVATLSDPAKT